jgi:hypothetical protein
MNDAYLLGCNGFRAAVILNLWVSSGQSITRQIAM